MASKDVVWEHGENLYPGWRCKYCHTAKSGGGATRLKHHLAGRGSDVVHCQHVPHEVRDYFRRELDRTKKAGHDRARKKLQREEAAAATDYVYDSHEEEHIRQAMGQSRAEAAFRQQVNQRGGEYEHGAGSGSRSDNPIARMFRRSSSQSQAPCVTDYNIASGKPYTQTRIDVGPFSKKEKGARESIGRAWSKWFHVAGVAGRQADNPYFVSAVRETQKHGKLCYNV